MPIVKPHLDERGVVADATPRPGMAFKRGAFDPRALVGAPREDDERECEARRETLESCERSTERFRPSEEDRTAEVARELRRRRSGPDRLWQGQGSVEGHGASQDDRLEIFALEDVRIEAWVPTVPGTIGNPRILAADVAVGLQEHVCPMPIRAGLQA